MNTEELKSLQAPLKEKYRAQPEAGRVTLRAEGRMGEGLTCKIETGQALVEAGLHPATGGNGLSACSGEMLLEGPGGLCECDFASGRDGSRNQTDRRNRAGGKAILIFGAPSGFQKKCRSAFKAFACTLILKPRPAKKS